ncbi:MAG: hypothetical protein IJ242_01195 [Clostridia bacterium]|nr:hypothetical protein [Clostridia bacterium]
MSETSIRFQCKDPVIKRIYDTAEARCLTNLRRFGQRTVLVEGGGYEKIWLETQPMGGVMYALRNLEAAKNNVAMFMDFQRADGRLPGSIEYHPDGQIEPQFNKYQGFCFPDPALDLYYLTGEDRNYLNRLKDTLRRFDECLWRTRDSNHDGILESFCVYDTGEDLAVRYADAPCWWSEDNPPEDASIVPMASMDVMSWSYASRAALAEIARIEHNEGEAVHWKRRSDEVAEAIHTRLWDASAGTCYDRDKYGRVIPILCHNPLRCMYWGSFSPDMADTFVRRHLLNPDEFWTPIPLPSVAANDPAFRNQPENNWSGQPEGLTYQRAITALERYGYHTLVTALGKHLLSAVADGGYRFTQQFDPFTRMPSLVHAVTHQPVKSGTGEPVQDAYGPTMLACLEYIAHRWGISPHRNQIWFSLGTGNPCSTAADCFGHCYSLENDGQKAVIRIDNKTEKTFTGGIRVICHQDGTVLSTVPIEP